MNVVLQIRLHSKYSAYVFEHFEEDEQKTQALLCFLTLNDSEQLMIANRLAEIFHLLYPTTSVSYDYTTSLKFPPSFHIIYVVVF